MFVPWMCASFILNCWANRNIVRLIHGFFNIVICCFKYGTQTFHQQCCPMCLKNFLRFGATFSTPLSTLRLSWKNLERCPLNISGQGIVFYDYCKSVISTYTSSNPRHQEASISFLIVCICTQTCLFTANLVKQDLTAMLGCTI